MDALVGIIGAGPAGLSAGVQLTRYGIDSIIYESNRIGGVIENAYRVENTMLFPSGLKGTDFVKILRDYVYKYSLRVIHREITEVRKENNFVVEPEGKEFKYLIVATGTRAKELSFNGIYYHISEILGRKYRTVLIVGGGDIAFDYSLSASEIADRVIVLYRSKIHALPALVNEVRKRENIKIIKGELIRSEDIVETTAGKWKVDVILGAIGRVPNIEIVSSIYSTRMFLVGDVKNGIYRQSALAIADGIKAAMQIWRCENGYNC